MSTTRASSRHNWAVMTSFGVIAGFAFGSGASNLIGSITGATTCGSAALLGRLHEREDQHQQKNAAGRHAEDRELTGAHLGQTAGRVPEVPHSAPP